MLTKDQRALLNAPFDWSKAVQAHESRSYLTVLKSMYVVERLNDVFGVSGWDLDYDMFKDSENEVIVQGRIVQREKEDQRALTTYQFGSGIKGRKGSDPADAYKSAVTDCLSKCASYLEIGIQVFKGEIDPTGKNSDNTLMSDKQVENLKKTVSDPQLQSDERDALLSWMDSKQFFDELTVAEGLEISKKAKSIINQRQKKEIKDGS